MYNNSYIVVIHSPKDYEIYLLFIPPKKYINHILNESDHPSDPHSSIPSVQRPSPHERRKRCHSLGGAAPCRGSIGADPPFTDDETALNGNLGWNGMV